MSKNLTHLDETGKAVMVDVSEKVKTFRTAMATGRVIFPQAVFDTLNAQEFLGKKGSIPQTAIIAGIQAAKQTSTLIPLCHQINLSKIHIDIFPNERSLEIVCIVKCQDRTGVEMEALTGVSIAALTIYDMCKALTHDIQISDIQLKEKTGGKNDFVR